MPAPPYISSSSYWYTLPSFVFYSLLSVLCLSPFKKRFSFIFHKFHTRQICPCVCVCWRYFLARLSLLYHHTVHNHFDKKKFLFHPNNTFPEFHLFIYFFFSISFCSFQLNGLHHYRRIRNIFPAEKKKWKIE